MPARILIVDDEAIVAELGGGRADFFEKLGEASAEKNLGAGGVRLAAFAAAPR